MKRRVAHEIPRVHIILEDVLALEDEVDLAAEDGVVDQRIPNLLILVIPLQHRQQSLLRDHFKYVISILFDDLSQQTKLIYLLVLSSIAVLVIVSVELSE